jgi:aromatic-L-amino-acid decarboxylase
MLDTNPPGTLEAMSKHSGLRPPVPALFPAREELDDWLTRELLSANERVVAGSVVPTIDMAAFRAELARFDFLEPQSLGELVTWSIAQLECGVVHLTHPRYFGLYNPAPTFPSQCADRIAGAFNPQLATWTTSPVAVEIEAHVMRSVAERAGMPAGSMGHFTSCGSEANYTAVLCALTRANSRFATDGARAFEGQPVFYASRESHLAWLKIAHQTGIGRSAARLIATDGTGSMDAGALADQIAADRAAGSVPVMIAATAGTTNAGMIDPLERCAEIARHEGLWYHVDAAWGGALIACEELASRLTGMEQADSITIDAHKWFATTMGAGMLLVREPSALSSVFRVSTTFMPSEIEHVDPYTMTAQWSRRFIGLRLFLSLAAAGWSGYADHVRRSLGLIELLREELAARQWIIANNSPLGVLCVEPPQSRGDVRAIARRVLDSGRAWVAAAKFEGRDVVRTCVTHGEASAADIEELVKALQRALERD